MDIDKLNKYWLEIEQISTSWTNADRKEKRVVTEELPMQVKIAKELLLHLIMVKKLRKRAQETEGETRATRKNKLKETQKYELRMKKQKETEKQITR